MPQSNRLLYIYEKLLRIYGSQSWWPANTPFEVMVGAILTQNTAWGNVEKALADLSKVCDLTPEGILSLAPEQLQEAIRPSGYFRQKAFRLRGFCQFLAQRYGVDPSSMAPVPVAELREELLSLHGIGPETADSILLYALGRPVFVVDAYTIRLFSRIGLCEEKAKYDDVQSLFMNNLQLDVQMFNEYHALIVVHSKARCRKREPVCEKCPLEDMCVWRSKFKDPKSKIQDLKSKKTLNLPGCPVFFSNQVLG
jgi:endonuclease-3 related protein